MRRAAGGSAPIATFGNFALDLTRMSATLGGRPVSLTPLEYRCLAYLALHRDQPVSPTELLEHLHGDEDAREQNALEALVARLRRKLGPGIIETRRGFGYLLVGA